MINKIYARHINNAKQLKILQEHLMLKKIDFEKKYGKTATKSMLDFDKMIKVLLAIKSNCDEFMIITNDDEWSGSFYYGKFNREGKHFGSLKEIGFKK